MNAPSRPEEFWRSRLRLPVYHVADAARYADISGGTIRNWHRPSNKPAALSRKEPREALSYLQLIELAVVAAARRTGVSLAAIRRARDYCSKELHSNFPFAGPCPSRRSSNVATPSSTPCRRSSGQRPSRTATSSRTGAPATTTKGDSRVHGRARQQTWQTSARARPDVRRDRPPNTPEKIVTETD